MAARMKQTAFRLPDELLLRLRQEARRQGLTMNATLIVTLRQALPPLDATATVDDAAQAANDDDALRWD